MVRQANITGLPFDFPVNVTAFECGEKITGKDDALPLPPCQSFFDQMFGARFHRCLHLPAKPAAKIMAITGEVSSIKPRDAGGINLRGQIHLRTHSQRHPLVPLPVFKLAQLDDEAGMRVAGRAHVGQDDVMGSAIYSVDDRVGCAIQLIMKAAINHAPNNFVTGNIGRKLKGRYLAFDSAFAKRSVHSFDDVSPRSHFAQTRFGIIVHHPRSGADF